MDGSARSFCYATIPTRRLGPIQARKPMQFGSGSSGALSGQSTGPPARRILRRCDAVTASNPVTGSAFSARVEVVDTCRVIQTLNASWHSPRDLQRSYEIAILPRD